MNKLRVGIVGVGFAGKYHVQCLRRCFGVDVEVAGITSRTDKHQAIARERQIRAFASVEEMLPHIDLLDVCSPPYVHEANILAAAEAGKGIICEKPLTGCFGPPGADDSYHGDREPKGPMLEELVGRLQRLAQTVRKHAAFFGYAENFVYAPSVQKEREIVEKTGAQILRMMGEESHNGSGSPVYGIWRFAGGGSLIGKGCHPLGAMLYLKRIEGVARSGRPIRPAKVSARVHQLTRLPGFVKTGFIRTDYHDIEDYGLMHVTFDDGTIADVMTSEIVLGGIYDYVEVFANNHRTRCHISPAHLADTYNPSGPQFQNVYLMEKISTQEGWNSAAPDENFTMGYQAELQDFASCAAAGTQPQSGLDLALDTTAAIYAAYLSDERGGQEVAIPAV